MKKKKYKLTKTILATSIIGGIVLRTVLPIKGDTNSNNILHNNLEDESIELFIEELKEIKETEYITFHNKELFELISNKVDGNLTPDNIRNIKTLTINERLNNTDLSDLKYLTGLKFLIIKDNQVNCEYLEYNQNLIGLSLENCTLINTEKLPNTLNNIRLSNSKLDDYTLVLPYNLQELTIYRTPINNINAKNNESIKAIFITGEVYISAQCLTNLTNLNHLSIKSCSSIKEAEYLCDIPNLKLLTTDEYSSIWLNEQTISKLPIFPISKISIKSKIKELDDIAKMLRDDSLTDLEQITKIISYLIEKYYYNTDVKADNMIGNIEASLDNLFPISQALKKEDIICINYATMFQSIANRLDIDSITLVNDIHAWNAYNIDGKYLRIDPTNLDSYVTNKGNVDITSEWVYAHSSLPSEYGSIYESVVYPLEEETLETYLGYIKEETSPENLILLLERELSKLVYNKMTFNLYANPISLLVPSLIVTEALYLYIVILGNKKESSKMKKDERILKKKQKNNN